VKTFNNKLDSLLIPILFGGDGVLEEDGSELMHRVIKAQKSRLNKTHQSIIDLICETVEEAKPDNRVANSWQAGIEVKAFEDATRVFQDNLINIVRGNK